jgi:hypothetical protein
MSEKEKATEDTDWTSRYWERLQGAKTAEERYRLELLLTTELFGAIKAAVPAAVRDAERAAAAALHDAEAGLADGQAKVAAHHQSMPAEASGVEAWTRERLVLEETVKTHEGRVAQARARHAAAVVDMRSDLHRGASAHMRQAAAAEEEAEAAARLMVEIARSISQIARLQPDRIDAWAGDA